MKKLISKGLLAVIFTVGLVACGGPIEQDVKFDEYNEKGEEIYTIYTYVWGRKNWETFIQWSDSDYNVKKINIEKIKAKQMKEAEKELAKLKEYQTD